MKQRLTDTEVKKLKPLPDGRTRKVTDGGGMFLLVTSSGAKHWRYKYRLGTAERLLALGSYPTMSLHQARQAHQRARALVEAGTDPVQQKQLDKLKAQHAGADTFSGVAEEWFAAKVNHCSQTYLAQIRRALDCEIHPEIGKLPLKSVVPAHVMAIMVKAQQRGAAVVAENLRQWISQIFRYGIVRGRCEVDHAAALRGLVKRPKIKHNVPLGEAGVKHLLRAVDAYGGARSTQIAIELLLLTFVRTGELRQADWAEFDLGEAKVWRIPKERMKMRMEHHVPLSAQAIGLLQELRAASGGSKLFPNTRRDDAYMSATTINRALERMGFAGKGTIGFAAHGFRGTASTLLHERGYRPEVIERQLAHAQKSKVAAAYNQAKYWPERVEMMQRWADSVDQLRPIRQPA